MTRKVKCVDTGEFSTNDVAFRAPNGKFYSSESAYLEMTQRYKLKSECVDAMYEAMGYESTMKLPTIFYKKLQEWYGCNYSYEIIRDTIKNCMQRFEYVDKTKTFNSQLSKTMYYCGIIENYLNDTLLEYKRMKELIATEEKEENIIDIDLASIGTVRKSESKAKSLLGDLI